MILVRQGVVLTAASNTISFRAKTHKPIGETLKPIISKYTPELTMEEIIIRKENSSDLINLDDPVLKLR